MAGIIFATVLIRIIRAISDASSSNDATPANDSVGSQPTPQPAPKSKHENRPPRHLPRASQAPQTAIEIAKTNTIDKGMSLQ